MGIRRLRARLDQMQGKANMTMDDAREVLAMAGDLVNDMLDGVELSVQVDDNAALEMAKILLGKGGTFPLRVAFDPTFDTKPSKVCKFEGGPYDGEKLVIPDDAIGDCEITLKGQFVYRWDGHVFKYAGDV